MSRVLDEILQEVRFSLDALGTPPVRTVFFGGGTPSSVPAKMLDSFLHRLTGYLPNIPLEWTVEANPESLSAGFLSMLSSHPVNRISVGIQSFQDRLLTVLGRRAGKADIVRALKTIEKSWRGEWSLDLISGIPGQMREEAEDDIREALLRQPSHISLYSLTLEEGTPLEQDIREGRIRGLPAETGDEFWIAGRDLLVSRGYRQYEISNFALPGKESCHNLRYWRMQPYLGCGPAAASTLPGKGGKVFRISHEHSLTAYLEGRKEYWKADIQSLDAEEFLLEHLLMGLRLQEGISRKTLRQIFSEDPEQLIGGTVARWKAGGLLSIDEERIALTGEGRLLLNRFLDDVVRERAQYEWGNSRILWPVAAPSCS